MSSDPAPRHQSRERALTLLYEADLKGEPPTDVLAALPVAAVDMGDSTSQAALARLNQAVADLKALSPAEQHSAAKHQ